MEDLVKKRNMRQKIATSLKNSIDLYTPNDLSAIYGDIVEFCHQYSPTLEEEAIFNVNKVIIIDALSKENVFYYINSNQERIDLEDREALLYETTKVLKRLEEYRNCYLSLQELLYYYVACLYFKVHNYSEAKNCFEMSKRASLRVRENDSRQRIRIKRDILIPYCYEYCGQPEEAIRFLFGEIDLNDLKKMLYKNRERIISILLCSKFEISPQYFYIIDEILKFDEFNGKFLIIKEILEKRNNAELAGEMDEVIHVLAHCFNEYKVLKSTTVFDIENLFENEIFGGYIVDAIMKLLSKKLIDTLGPRYTTCQATIYAENGDSEHALDLLSSYNPTDEKESAEKDFYLFYFSELFSDLSSTDADARIKGSGQAFLNFCLDTKRRNILGNNEKNDALLHYYIFEIKHLLRIFFEEILRTDDRDYINEAFYRKEYSETLKTDIDYIINHFFSYYANDEICKELDILRLCLYIIQEVKSKQLPLFFSDENPEQILELENGYNQLFELCKAFNMRYSFPEITKRHSPSIISGAQEDGRTYTIHGLIFDVFLDDYTLLSDIIHELFDINDDINVDEEYCILRGSKENLRSTNKLIFTSERGKELCEYYYQEMQLFQEKTDHGFEKREVRRVFLLNSIPGTYPSKPFARFPRLINGIIMAYVYDTIDRIISYICEPKQIAILAPLRDTESYYFQCTNIKDFVPLKTVDITNYNVCSTGLGTFPYIPGSKREEITVKFLNKNIMDACFCGIKFENEKLYVLRKKSNSNDLSAKMIQQSINRGLVDKFFKYYYSLRIPAAKARTNCTNAVCKLKKKKTINCQYVFGHISDLSRDPNVNLKHVKKHFLELLVIACKEDVFNTDDTYILEHKINGISGMNETGFEIFLFSNMINPTDYCCSEWIIEIPHVENRSESYIQADSKENVRQDQDNIEKKIADFRAKLSTDYNCWLSDLKRYREKWMERQDGFDPSTTEYIEAGQKIEGIENLLKRIYVDLPEMSTFQYRTQSEFIDKKNKYIGSGRGTSMREEIRIAVESYRKS